MLTITVEELKTNLDKYLVLGQKETINITYKNKIIFAIVPQKTILLNKLENLFGSLPREVYKDDKINRE